MTGHPWRLAAMALAVACAVAACGRAAPPPAGRADVPEHEHIAPHGGTLVELGEEYAHLEFVFDQAGGVITLYVLDGEAEEPVRSRSRVVGISLDQPAPLAGTPLALQGQSSVLTGETVDSTSEFLLKRADLTLVPELTGKVLSIEVRGREFRDVPFRVPATARTPE